MFGTFDETGAITAYPKTDILGGAFERPATIYRVDATRFVVLPPSGLPEDRIKELIGDVSTEKSSKPNVRRKGDIPPETENLTD